MINLNALPPPKPNYEMILNNLMKYLKKKIPFEQYCDIRQYVENEIKHPTKSESLSSLFANRTNIATLTNNEKKLKLSYDFSNMVTSPKEKPIKIKISSVNQKKSENQQSDSHSLYTIVKKEKPSKTQSNSKSKSTSREHNKAVNNITSLNCNHHNILSDSAKVAKGKINNQSQLVLNEKLFSKLNLTKQKNQRSNNNIRTNLVTNKLKQNCKINNNANKSKAISNNQCKSNRSNFTSQLNSTRVKSKQKESKIPNKDRVKSTSTNHNNKQPQHTATKVHSNKTTIITSNISNNTNSTNVKSGYIDLNERKKNLKNVGEIKKKNSIKNEEMMKEIKNTLDDNLKVMFNFSYENFLSKESESESKKSSQQEIIITESYD